MPVAKSTLVPVISQSPHSSKDMATLAVSIDASIKSGETSSAKVLIGGGGQTTVGIPMVPPPYTMQILHPAGALTVVQFVWADAASSIGLGGGQNIVIKSPLSAKHIVHFVLGFVVHVSIDLFVNAVRATPTSITIIAIRFILSMF